jgi:phage-related tail protein
MPAFTPVGVEATVRNFGKFNNDLKAMNKAIQQSGKHSEQAAKATKRFNTTLTSLSAGGLDMVLRSLVTFGKAVVEEGAAFQKAMSNVGAIAGATGADFQKLEQQAVNLGSTTKFTAIEAAEGMSFLAMAGFETNEIVGALPGTLSLAAAGNLDLGTSADIVSNILQGFGANAEQTKRFVDVLAKTFTTSNTNLVQLPCCQFSGLVRRRYSGSNWNTE